MRNTMLMPFGKYHNEPIKSLPLTYLRWLVTNDIIKEANLHRLIEYTFQFRTEEEEMKNSKRNAP